MSEETICVWVFEHDDVDLYETGCNRSFFFYEGRAQDNEFNFCPFCGDKIFVIDDDE